MKRAKRPFPVRRDSLAEAARPVYLIAASVQYALNELLKAKTKHGREEQLLRIEQEAKYLGLNVKMLRREVENAN